MDDKNQNDSGMKFTVMPDLEDIGKMPKNPPPAPDFEKTSSAPVPPAPKVSSSIVMPPVPPSAPAKQITSDVKARINPVAQVPEKSGGRFGTVIAILGLLVLLVAGYVGYAYWVSERSASEALQNPQQNNRVPQNNQAVDTDNDGLSDEEEEDLGTGRTSADSDGDNLADGDEVKVFKSDPLSPKTDSDIYDDGNEVSNGYSPVLDGIKMSSQEVEEVVNLYKQNKLHQPTTNLLQNSASWKDKLGNSIVQSSVTSRQSGFTYQDATYGYQVILPGSWRKNNTTSASMSVFTENNSANAKNISIQVHSDSNAASLVSSELDRLSKNAYGDVRVKSAQVGGRSATALSADSQRNSAGMTLMSSTIEYIVAGQNNAFVVAASCTDSKGASCASELESLAAIIEKDFRF